MVMYKFNDGWRRQLLADALVTDLLDAQFARRASSQVAASTSKGNSTAVVVHPRGQARGA